MLPFELLLVASLAAASAQPLAAKSAETQVRFAERRPSSRPLDHYQCFGGHVESYPDPSNWLSWNSLWDINREQVLSANGGDTYLRQYVQESILKVASESRVDARFILAIVMQETKGQVTAGCEGIIPRCGIMNAPKGSTFDGSGPRESITKMIRDGVEGSRRSGPGLAKLLSGKPAIANLPKGNAYSAARAYNSDTVGKNLDVVSHGQPRYVNDIANRLIGWDGTGKAFTQCR